jgi:hypothetical protein
LWPGCSLPKHEDVVEVDVDSLSSLEPQQLFQFVRSLGFALSAAPTVDEALRVLRASELDETNARGHKGTRR